MCYNDAFKNISFEVLTNVYNITKVVKHLNQQLFVTAYRTEHMNKIMIKILQHSVVTQTMLGGLNTGLYLHNAKYSSGIKSSLKPF